MPFEGMITCPKCAGRFRVGLPLRRPPTGRDVFEVVCPINASRIRFRAVACEGSGMALVEELREVAKLGGCAHAALVSGGSGIV
jgi:hypothetical protein